MSKGVPNTEQDFWRFVRKGSLDGCWVWTGARSKGGYGNFRLSGKQWRASRLSYVIHFGAVPDGLFVCHHCDNPPCVNPNHLYAATNSQNIRDADARGLRHSLKGEAHNMAKLTTQQVKEIQDLYVPGEIKQSEIAIRYGISQANVSLIVRGMSWTS